MKSRYQMTSPGRMVMPNNPSFGSYLYACFMIIFSLTLLGISSVALYYIESTKTKVNDPNITGSVIITSEAAAGLAITVSCVMFISSVMYIKRQ